jgi:hypothetical protein
LEKIVSITEVDCLYERKLSEGDSIHPPGIELSKVSVIFSVAIAFMTLSGSENAKTDGASIL